MPKGSKRKRPAAPSTPRPAVSGRLVPPPWAPTAVFAWTLIAGPVYGGIFAVANLPRMRLGHLLFPTLLMAAVAQAAPEIAIRVYHFAPADARTMGISLLMRAIAAYYYSLSQREMYWTHLDAGGRSANLTWPTLGALLLFPLPFLFGPR